MNDRVSLIGSGGCSAETQWQPVLRASPRQQPSNETPKQFDPHLEQERVFMYKILGTLLELAFEHSM